MPFAVYALACINRTPKPTTLTALKPILLLAIFLPAIAAAQQFERVTTGDAAIPAHNSSSCSFADYDNDGDPDLFVTNGESDQPNEFYENNGDGTFTGRPDLGITNKNVPSFASAWADVDNDGDLDLLVLNNFYRTSDPAENFMFLNQGNGEFANFTDSELTEAFGLSLGAAFADYDNDGWLDVAIAGADGENRLYRNHGNGSYDRVQDIESLFRWGISLSMLWADFNNDNRNDLMVVNYQNSSQLLRNDGAGQWTQMTSTQPFSQSYGTRSASWGDVDNDGFLDLLMVSNHATKLFHNNGDETFTELSEEDFPVYVIEYGGGSVMADFNNDGWLDCIMGTDGRQFPHYMQNDGDGTFSIINDNAIADLRGKWCYGMAAADINGDGYQDVMMALRQESTRDPSENGLFLNTSTACDNSSALVDLRGTVSNTFGVGAMIRAYTTVDNTVVQQMRQVNTQSGGGYSGQSELTAHFGFGVADTIDSLTVLWPSGIECRYYNLGVDSRYLFTEGCETTVTEFAPLQLTGIRNPNCNGRIVRIESEGGHAPLTWTEDISGVTLAHSANLDVQSAAAPATYILTDGCGQSDTLSVTNDILQLNASPNPIHSAVTVQLVSNVTEEVTVSVINALGQAVEWKRFLVQPGWNAMEFSLGHHPSGLYIIDLQSTCINKQQKVIVAH